MVRENVVTLQEVVKLWHEGMTQKLMKINAAAGRTDFMCISSRNEEFEVNIRQSKLIQVSEYTYSWIYLNSKNLQETEIDRRISKYNAKLAILFPLIKGYLFKLNARKLFAMLS